MEIRVKKIEVRNFKGAKHEVIEFSDNTDILGANGVGKTRIKDAFSWCLFGKDSHENKSFSYKPLNIDGETNKELDVEVILTLDVDGRLIVFKRVLREEWSKRRGSAELYYKGNSTKYFVDEVPMLLKEYNFKVQTIVDEEILQLITNPMYFMSIEKKERRRLIESMFVDFSDEKLYNSNPEYKELYKNLEGKSVIEFRKMIVSQKNVLKKEVKGIPGLIEENERGKPEVEDWQAIEKEIGEKESKIEAIDKAILNTNSKLELAQEEELERVKKKGDLKLKIMNLEHEAEVEAEKDLRLWNVNKTNLKNAISDCNSNVNELSAKIEALKGLQNKNESSRNILLADWHKIKDRKLKYDSKQFSCDCCKQPLPDKDREQVIEEMQRNFNAGVASDRKMIQKEGGELKAKYDLRIKEIKTLEDSKNDELDKIAKIDLDIEILNQSKPSVKNVDLSNDIDYVKCTKELKALEALEPISMVNEGNEELLVKKQEIRADINGLRLTLNAKELIKAKDIRIEELSMQETELNEAIALKERLEFAADSFFAEKMSIIEQSVNRKFKHIKIKLFEGQINEGINDVCYPTFNGIPYKDLNTAMRINAGLEIVKVFSEYHDIFAPVWVDHAESITDVWRAGSQLIKLIVDKDEKKLKVLI